MMLAASSLLSAPTARAQEIGYRDFGRTVDSEAIPADPADALPEIGSWLPPEEFAEEVRESLAPAVSMSSVMKAADKASQQHIYILPNNVLRLWRINISNGSAGNWGAPPMNFLDARTLSFPVPR